MAEQGWTVPEWPREYGGAGLSAAEARVLRAEMPAAELPRAAAELRHLRPEPLVCVAKAKAGDTATLAVQEGVQMHGGIGMTDEFDIGFFMKRARTAQEWLGDANWQLDRWATLRGY